MLEVLNKKYTHSNVFFTDLDQSSEMIIFESLLTTFITSFIFRGSWGNSKNRLELKIEQKCRQI